MASFTIQAPPPAEAKPAAPAEGFSGEAALLLTAALAGASMSKSARRQYRALTRKMAWKALGNKIKGMFSRQQRADQIFGLEPLVFWLLVAAVALLGILLFGFWGFLVIAALGVIIYLLLKQNS